MCNIALLFGIIFTNYFNQIDLTSILISSINIILNSLETVVGTGRFELPTSRLSVVRSNQLSYAPAAAVYHSSFLWKKFAGQRQAISAHPLFFLRKEVIQPQVPLRLPCYDFTPVADLTVVGCPPYGSANRLRVKPTPMV